MKYYIIIALAIMSFLTAACDNHEDKKGRFLLKGNEKVKDNDYEGAIKFYSEALAVDPNFRDALYNRGLIYQRLNRLDQSIADYSIALQSEPLDFEVLFQRGLAYLDNGEFYKAQNDSKVLIDQFSNEWRSHFLSGLVSEKLKQDQEALEAFDKGLQLQPDNVDLITNKATILYYKKDYQQAEELLQIALSKNPQEANIYNLSALIALENEKYVSALDLVEKAIELDPRNPYFFNNKGLINIYLGNLEDGLKNINQSIKQDPRNNFALRNKGIYYYYKGDKTLAMQYLKELYEKFPEMELVEKYYKLTEAL